MGRAGRALCSAVNEKLTTPPETLPMVSQLWSLLGAKRPVSDWLVGSTGGSASLPAAASSLTVPAARRPGAIP